MKGGNRMNKKELAAELARNNLTIPKAANAIGIGKKAFYDKLEGRSEFKQTEIWKLKQLLSLSDERMLEIFFAEEVS